MTTAQSFDIDKSNVAEMSFQSLIAGESELLLHLNLYVGIVYALDGWHSDLKTVL